MAAAAAAKPDPGEDQLVPMTVGDSTGFRRIGKPEVIAANRIPGPAEIAGDAREPAKSYVRKHVRP